MARYLTRRLLQMILTLFIITTATFFLLSAIPGDPLTEKVAKLPPNIKAEMYKKYGYDRPVVERYYKAMKGIITRGDFGQSVVYPGQTMQSIIKEKLPVSARLGIQQALVGVTVGLLLGIIAAMKRGSWADHMIVTLSMVLISTPTLVCALLIQKYLAGSYFPIIGWPKGQNLWFGGWKYTILPTLSGCLGYIASYSRLMKTSMLDSVNQDYILTARAKGLSETKIVFRHVLRNSFIPIVTILPLTIAFVITGSFFIERVYSIPGIGLYFIGAVTGRDVPIIMGETVLLTIIYLVVIFFTDILYTIVDPRIRILGTKR
ncbi:ABC transporter permease [Gorillibacterium timonense]|uniref:ABC transporter permease n=1 Tax=Gorillibacterium timonense TaxID=1689269 RepID=UPI00071DB5EE|nr:ABC transporter permease [Gorillibacterium timonense]